MCVPTIARCKECGAEYDAMTILSIGPHVCGEAPRGKWEASPEVKAKAREYLETWKKRDKF